MYVYIYIHTVLYTTLYYVIRVCQTPNHLCLVEHRDFLWSSLSSLGFRILLPRGSLRAEHFAGLLMLVLETWAVQKIRSCDLYVIITINIIIIINH